MGEAVRVTALLTKPCPWWRHSVSARRRVGPVWATALLATVCLWCRCSAPAHRRTVLVWAAAVMLRRVQGGCGGLAGVGGLRTGGVYLAAAAGAGEPGDGANDVTQGDRKSCTLGTCWRCH
ncbi:hypothetical protein ACP70R_003427 [Stipagrostis hirtigluma subsp. patula]